MERNVTSYCSMCCLFYKIKQEIYFEEHFTSVFVLTPKGRKKILRL